MGYVSTYYETHRSGSHSNSDSGCDPKVCYIWKGLLEQRSLRIWALAWRMKAEFNVI